MRNTKMASVTSRILFGLYLACLSVTVCDARETCYVGYLDWDYCDYGCCDDSYSSYKRCCTYAENSIGLIVGLTIGGIVLVFCVVVGICLCFHCTKTRGRTGIVRPQHQTHVIHTSTVPGHYPGHGPPPPPYQQQPGYGPPPAPYPQQPAYGPPSAPYPQQPGYPPAHPQDQALYPPTQATTSDETPGKY